jgi:hypothetical protein
MTDLATQSLGRKRSLLVEQAMKAADAGEIDKAELVKASYHIADEVIPNLSPRTTAPDPAIGATGYYSRRKSLAGSRWIASRWTSSPDISTEPTRYMVLGASLRPGQCTASS